MSKKIINVKDWLEGVKSTSLFLQKESYIDTINGIDVYQQKGYVALAIRGVVGMATMSFQGDPIIVLDEFNEKMTDKYGKVFKDFTIGHELGHIENGDLEKHELKQKDGLIRTLEIENKADEYSMKYNNLSKKQVVYVLKAMRKECPWYFLKPRRELKKRIKYINSL